MSLTIRNVWTLEPIAAMYRCTIETYTTAAVGGGVRKNCIRRYMLALNILHIYINIYIYIYIPNEMVIGFTIGIQGNFEGANPP